MDPIASQAAILRAAKAVPGGARPTPPPQGANIGIGQISQLALDLGQGAGYSNAYGPFLPRPARTFTQGAFGPFSPILPVPVDEPPPGADLPDPRRFNYPTGFNLPSVPGNDGFKLASFSTLSTISRLYSIARTCIERRKSAIAGLEWDIVPTKEASKAYQNDHDAYRDWGERRAKAVKFFNRPDPDFDDFGSFLSALLEQVFVYDAMSLVLKPKRGRGLKRGLLGSDLDCLSLIDGSTVRPLLSLSGGRPRPPAPGFQQYIAGVPRADLQTMWSGQDIEDAGLKGYEGPAFSVDQLMYRPIVPRVDSPYGFGPTEQALIVIMTGLQKQAFQLDYWREGTVPAVYISPGDVNITPTQIRELQSALNAYAGDPAWHHKIIVLPPDAKVMPQRSAELADQFDEFLANEIAMVYDMDPMALGIVPSVSTTVSPFAAREMAAASKTVHERTSTKPLLKYLVSIAHGILHRVCSQDDMKFTFAGMDEAQDQAAQTDLLVKQVQNGMISIDEAREELQRTAWGLDETSGPLVFTQMGPVPLNQIIQLMQQQQPMQTGQTAAANASGAVAGTAGGSTQSRAVHHPPSSRPVGTHNPRLGLPSGSPAGPELPPEGPGRRASDTPAHTAARAHSAANGRPARKAVTAEMEALARHLRKGRNIGSWRANYLSGQVMASLAEDLTRGLTVDEAVREALTIALPAGDYEWSDAVKAAAPPPFPPEPPNQTPAQRQAQALAQKYAARIRQVFAQVAKQAASLIAKWLSGVLAVTAAALAGMIGALLAKLLQPVLRDLWAEAWKLGRSAAADALGTEPPADDDAAFNAWADSHGRDWLEQITDTNLDDVTAGLDESARNGEDAETIASKLLGWLGAAARWLLIAVDQVQRALNAAMAAVGQKLGVVQKRVITRGDSKVCARCRANAAEGWVNFSQPYPSGELGSPFHPRCRCRTDLRVSLNATQKAARGTRYVDLPGQELWWPADSYPSGPAMGGGGAQHAAHDADDIQQYIPGGVPGMTAGGEPPRWNGGEPDAVVSSPPQTVSAGRGNTQTRGGGTVSGPYEDFSDRTHVHVPDDSDDAAWPGERGVGPVAGRSWPLQGYMGGHWPEGGHGTAQAPGGPVAGGTERGRAPSAFGKASGYSLNPRSGMISLDLPEGTVEPVPGGVDDHHVTVVYLGPDVDDGAFALACLRAQQAAAAMPGPLAGVISGIGSFPASNSSDGKVPAWAGVMLPGAEQLREALADLSASEHVHWKPHMTLAYCEPGEDLPAAVPPTPVTFTHLSVHRGEDVERFPLGSAPAGVTKDASDLTDPSPVEAAHVKALMEKNFPEKALTWIEDEVRWIGPIHVPLDRVNFANEDSWAASHQPGAVKRFAKAIKHGTGHTQPVVMVQKPGEMKLDVVDGHHRTLACRKLGWPVKAYVGFVPRDDGPWDETHSYQLHQGADPQNKSAETPAVSTVHHPLGTEGLWRTPSKKVPERQQLPAYVQNTARALMRDQGMGESEAIATAINAVKEWAEGRAFGGHVHVTPEVQAAAQRALAEWAELRASHAG